MTRGWAALVLVLLAAVMLCGPAVAQTPAAETLATGVTAGAGPSAEVQQRRERWRQHLRAGQSFRALLDDARAHPEAGGELLAMQIGLVCSDVDLLRHPLLAGTPPDVNHPAFSESLAAQTRLERLCDPLTTDERALRLLRGGRTLAEARQNTRDPYYAAWLGLRNQREQDAATRRDAVTQGLRYFDYDTMAGLLPSSREEGQWFDGRWYALNNEGDGGVLTLAQVLLSCRFDLPCPDDNGEGDLLLMSDCMRHPAACSLRNRHQLARAMAAELGMAADAYPKAVALAGRMASAIRERRVDAFIAP